MKYMIVLVLLSTVAIAQDDVADANTTADEVAVFGLEKCGDVVADYKSVADFVKHMKGGELIEPEDLVNNPNFLNPCFKEMAGIYTSSFDALVSLSNSINTYNQSELNNINKVNSQLESLGDARKGSKKSKEKPKGPFYSSSFLNFKKKAQLVGTVESGGGYVAHIRYGSVPVNDIKVGDVIKGVEIISIDFGKIVYKDTSASRMSRSLFVGG